MENDNIKQEKNKCFTKNNIILFVVGVLVGAIVATGAFLAYVNIAGVGSSNNQSMQMPGGTPPEMPSGNSGGTPPEMPNDSNSGGQNSDSEQSNSNEQSGRRAAPLERSNNNSTSANS